MECSKYIFPFLVALTAGCSGGPDAPSYESLVCYDPSKQWGMVEFVNATSITRNNRTNTYTLRYNEEDGSTSPMVYLQREGEACTILSHDTAVQNAGATLTVPHQPGREGFGA